LEDFKSVRKFKIFNTNNLWLNLPALKRVMETEGLDLEIIINQKSLDDGQPVIQLETAAGAAIKHFKGAHGVNVPRSRFLPVKSCSDLLLIKSDIYSLEHGQLVINPSRMFENTPVIKLGDHFKKVSFELPTPMKSLLSFAIPDFFFHFCADPTIPEAIQEDPEDHRARPSDSDWRCEFRTKRDATWDGDHRGE
jgi:hypothetical protein